MDTATSRYNYNDSSSIGSNNLGDTQKLLLGALAGAAVGSLVASLYTEKGIETRSRVSDRSRKIAHNIKEKATDISEGLKDKVSSVTAPIADKYQSTKKVATKLFAKEKPLSSISHLHGDYDTYQSEDEVEISNTKVLLTLLAASLAGTVIWSFTTEKGKSTRIRAAQSSQEVAGKLKVKATKLAEELQKAYDTAKEGVEDLMERQRQQASNTSGGHSAYSSSTGSGGALTS